MRVFNTRSGMTLLEVLLAATLFSILIYKAVMTLSTAMEASSTEMTDIVVEDHARKVLHQVAKAVMSSDRETLNPATPAPFSSDDIRYRVNLGIQDGAVVWSDPELIALEEDEERVFWARNPDSPESVRVVWTSLVSPYLEGEIPNGMDDNGNGLIDERGLSFDVDRNAITIRLTLDRTVDGRAITKTVETTVTCRNLEPDAAAP